MVVVGCAIVGGVVNVDVVCDGRGGAADHVGVETERGLLGCFVGGRGTGPAVGICELKGIGVVDAGVGPGVGDYIVGRDTAITVEVAEVDRRAFECSGRVPAHSTTATFLPWRSTASAYDSARLREASKPLVEVRMPFELIW